MDNEQIKTIIESCHLNFLIGSGVSTPYFSTLGTIEKLLTELENDKKLSSHKKIIIETSIKKHYFDLAIKGNLNFVKKNVLSRVKKKQFLDTKDSYKNFLNSLNIILSKRITNLIGKQVNFFTTNMDLFLENTLEHLKFSFNDGFFGRLNPVFGTENFHNSIHKVSPHYEFQSEVPLFNVFKLHGSVNWKQKTVNTHNNSIITFDYGLSVLKRISNCSISANNVLDIKYLDSDNKEVFYTFEELKANLEKNKISKKKEHECFLSEYNKLLMINPTKEKFETTTRDLTFYELLRMYSNQLERENSVLFVIGFSFADEHIREITKRVAIANPTLIIIIFAYNGDAKLTIQEYFKERTNVKILFPKSEDKPFSLNTVNLDYFSRLAEELERPKKGKCFISKESIELNDNK